MFDLALKSRGFETHRGHCVVALTKVPYPLLSTGSTQEDRKASRHDWKFVNWDVKQHQHTETKDPRALHNDVARTLKIVAHRRETTGSSIESLQLRPFSKWELLLKKRICSQRERILSFKSSPLWYERSLLPHW